MRYWLCLFIIAWIWDSVSAQVNNSADAEFQIICQIDSIGPGYQVEFARRISLTNPTLFTNLTADLTSNYTPTGTVIPCFRLTGTSECWYRNETVSYTKYCIDFNNYVAPAPPLSPNDLALTEVIYSDFYSHLAVIGTTQDAAFKNYRLPLAYPYLNTSRDSARLKRDLEEILECLGAETNNTKVTTFTTSEAISFCIESANFFVESAKYSQNSNSANSLTIPAEKTTNTATNFIARRIGDLYRKQNGAIYYFINWQGTLIAPPISGLNYKINCNFETEKKLSCNKPVGGSECWITPIDTPLCSYYLSIPYYCRINGIYVGGTNIITGTYIPNDTTTGVYSKIYTLSNSVNKYIVDQNKWGTVSIDNKRGGLGWVFHINYSDLSFDSVTTFSNGNFYFKKINCQEYHWYEVTRNELGGVLTCVDEFGNRAWLNNASRKINCMDLANNTDCQNKNRVGSETILSGTKIYDLSKYHSFSIVILAGSATYTGDAYNGSPTPVTISTNFSEKHTAETNCKYLKGTITIQANPGCVAKITYIW
ncbi:MAG TPA: hypothetical protein PK006_12365 [Saprospiraceae bacterium]|nr:hypothetical protein [Saprospiraceae bacterium]